MKIIIFIILLSIGVRADNAALFGILINIVKNDTLNVRSQANYRSEKVGEIPDGWSIGISRCKKVKNARWCKVYPLIQMWSEKFWEEKNIGWVNARYLRFSNRGYVMIKGKRNCAYVLDCHQDKCEVVDDFGDDNEIDYRKTGLKTKWIEKMYLRGDSNFGVTPDNVDGVCNTGMFIEDYLKKVK